MKRVGVDMAVRSAGLCLLGVTSLAAAGEFDAELAIGVIRTDNVTLVPVNPELATVLSVVPGLTYTQDSGKLTADVAYRLDGYYYEERDETRGYNLLDADLAFGLVPDRFFLDLGGSRSQAVIDPRGKISFDNLAIIGNRVDRDDLYVGPSFQVPVGDNVVVNGDLRRTWLRYADELPTQSGLSDSEADEGGLSVDNYRKGVGLSWAARYVDQAVDYGASFAPYRYRQAYVELGFWVNPETRLFVVGGRESPWDAPFESGLTDSFWEAGVVRELGEKFRAELAVGDRSFGSGVRAELAYDFDHGKTAFSYDELPTTNANDRFNRGGLLDPDEPNDYLFRAGSGERYISKRLDWSLDLEWERYAFACALFDESREERTGVNGAPLGDERQSGASVDASWQLGSRTQLYVRALRVDREFAGGGTSDVAAAAFGTAYRLGRNALLSLELERREQTSEPVAALSYRADLISVVWARTF
jgi:hypothetical protein